MEGNGFVIFFVFELWGREDRRMGGEEGWEYTWKWECVKGVFCILVGETLYGYGEGRIFEVDRFFIRGLIF